MSPSESPIGPCPCRAPTCLRDTHGEKLDGSSRCPASARHPPSIQRTAALSHQLKVNKHSVIVDVASELGTKPLKHSHKANLKSMCKLAQSLITAHRLTREGKSHRVTEEPVLDGHEAFRDPLGLLHGHPLLVHLSRHYLTHVLLQKQTQFVNSVTLPWNNTTTKLNNKTNTANKL